MKGKTKCSIKNNNGITLIALVVTIIVLIILAGISINLVLGENGIITKAKEAKKVQEIAELKEKIQMEIAAKEMERLEDGEILTQSDIKEILEPKYGTVNKNDNGTIKSLKPTDKDYEIPFEEIYEGRFLGYLADNVSVGDYVAYDATNNYDYTSEVGTGMSHGNGYADISGGQTFTSSSSLKWRVLSTDTTTKEVVLISEVPILTDKGEKFYLYGAIGYLYAEQELNEICKIYGYGKGANTSKVFEYETGDLVEGVTTGRITGSGARSINVSDINIITGYVPTEGTPYEHTIYYPTINQISGVSTSTVNRTDIYTYYSYTGSTYISGPIYNTLFTDTIGSSNINYWLASRCVRAGTTWASFNMYVVDSGNVDRYALSSGGNNEFFEDSNNRGIRPVVYLKSTVETIGKDKNGAWIIVD